MSMAKNRKAFHDYDILEEYEAGIQLSGTEVKSIRAGHVSLKEAHIRIINSEAFLINCHISPYEQGNINNKEPNRTRKLLLKRKEIDYLYGKVKEQGLALVPLKMYIKNRHIKLELALAKGRKLYDKRQVMKDKDVKRDIERAFKGSNRD